MHADRLSFMQLRTTCDLISMLRHSLNGEKVAKKYRMMATDDVCRCHD